MLDKGLVLDDTEFPGPIRTVRMIYPKPLSYRPLLETSQIPDMPPELTGTLVSKLHAPRTADVQGSARMALDHLLYILDPNLESIPFAEVRSTDSGWEREHEAGDSVGLAGRTLEAMLVLRRTTGSDADLDQEQSLRRSLLERVNSNGLAFRLDSGFADLEADIYDQADYLHYLVTWLELEDVTLVRALIGANARGLLLLADQSDEGIRFKHRAYLPDGSKASGGDVDRTDPCLHGGNLILPLTRAAQNMDDPIVTQLASGLVEYTVKHSGAFPENGPPQGDLHSRASTLLGILHYADMTKNPELRKWALGHVQTILGMGTEWGWFPSAIGQGYQDGAGVHSSPTGVLADMMRIALFLAKDDPSWYEVAERLGRNQLLAAQWPDNAEDPMRGAFCSSCSATARGTGINSYSTAAGAQAMSLLAENIATSDERGVRINFLINGGNRDVIVLSEIPYRGRVTIEARTECRPFIRIPPWVENPHLDGEPISNSDIQGVYLDLGRMRPRGQHTLSFDLPERIENIELAGTGVTVVWRGNAVIALLSSGTEQGAALYSAEPLAPDEETPLGTFSFFVAIH